MTLGDARISSSGKRRLRFGCIYTLIVLGLGFYAGLAATKRALTGPEWMRKYAGIVLPAPPQPAVSAPQTPVYGPPAQQAPPPQQPAVQGAPPVQTPSRPSGPPAQSAQNPDNAAPPSHAPISQTPPEGGWLVGTWEVTDELHRRAPRHRPSHPPTHSTRAGRVSSIPMANRCTTFTGRMQGITC